MLPCGPTCCLALALAEKIKDPEVLPVKLTLTNMSSSAPLLKRIRVKSPQDIARLYPLILDFHAHPERAAGVTEIVLTCGIKRELYLRKTDLPKQWKAREAARDPPVQSPLWEAVRLIGIPPAQEDTWVKMLSWMEPDLVAARTSALDNLGAPRQVQPWVKHQDTVFAQYAAAMLLALCLNLETLVYEDTGCRGVVFDLLERNNEGLESRPFLQNLQHVHLLPTSDFPVSDERFYNDLDVLRLMRLFHRLPSIRSVTASAVSSNNDADFEESIPSASPSITAIHMNRVSFPSTVIAALIRLPTALEEFTYTTGGRATSGGGFFPVSHGTMGQALWCQRASLTHLDLDLDQYLTAGYDGDRDNVNSDGDDWEVEAAAGNDFEDPSLDASTNRVETSDLSTGRAYNSTIGSLHDFERLKHLKIGVELLLGPNRYGTPVAEAPFRLVDALPRSLETLTVRGYTRDQQPRYDEQIDELLASVSEKLPNLRVVEGVDKLVPSGEDVRRPDENQDKLWKPLMADDDWQWHEVSQPG